jgi:antitoxin MazE
MKVKIVPIGNSRGIRIPKPLLEQCAIRDEADLRLEGDRLVVTAHRPTPRAGWAAAAEQMHQSGDDELLIPDVFEDEPEVEW